MQIFWQRKCKKTGQKSRNLLIYLTSTEIKKRAARLRSGPEKAYVWSNYLTSKFICKAYAIITSL